VVEGIDPFFDFGRKTDAMQFIAALQSAHDFTDFADLADSRTRVSILDVDACFRLHAFRGVVVVIRNVTRTIFYEIVVRIKTRALDALSRRGKKVRALCHGHIEIDSFEQATTDEATAEFAQDRIA